MKKLVSVLLAAGLIFTPVGGTIVDNLVPAQYSQVKEADARGYRSPVRSFKSNNNGINRSNVNRSQTNANAGKRGFFSGGGLMGGLMMGGIAGLLFGGLLSGMGAFGNILGLMINILAIILIIRLVMMLFSKRKNRHAEPVVESSRGNHADVQHETIQAGTSTREEILDEGNISNAVIAFFTHEKGLTLDDVQVALTYDDKIGFGADVIQNDRVIQQLDHFSLIQAIRYWAEHFAHMDPNMGLKLEYSERDGIYAVVTE
ncbi:MULTISPECIES: DUF2653 family protein [Listeria]|uniref:DUF2653 family protein n=1 Tax=Listeria TaxID=1637 RepID=UPI000B591A51|nr:MULTISPECIES: DUF2653 family protein [Listeria]